MSKPFDKMNTLKSFLLPPSSFFLLGLLGAVLLRKHRRAGIALLVLTAAGNYLLSLQPVSELLCRTLETYASVDRSTIQAARAQAIVVLGGGYQDFAPEYGHGPTLHERTLARTRYAAHLQKETGLPVLASGGSSEGRRPEAELMADMLKDELGIDPSLVSAEPSSRNTWQNAENSAAILRARNIGRIFLVTTAIHEPRAVDAFEEQGLEVIPAPTDFAERTKESLFMPSNWLPSVRALVDSHFVFYEWFGRIWYAIAHRAPKNTSPSKDSHIQTPVP